MIKNDKTIVNKILDTNQENCITYIGKISSTKTYNLGDYGYIKKHLFVCIKDKVNGDTSNTDN